MIFFYYGRFIGNGNSLNLTGTVEEIIDSNCAIVNYCKNVADDPYRGSQ